MKTLSQSPLFATLVLVAFLCAQLGCSTLQSIQNNPGVQDAETVAAGIGMYVATGSPAFGFVAPIAVNGLTALVDGSNPTAVTGAVAQDAQLIASTVEAAIPNPVGKSAAAQIAAVYTQTMNGTPGTPATATSRAVPAIPALPATPAAANAVLGAIAVGRINGASAAPASGPRGHRGRSFSASINSSFRPDIEAFILCPVFRIGAPYPRATIDETSEPRTLRRDEQSISSPV